MKYVFVTLFFCIAFYADSQPNFVREKGGRFLINGKPYKYIGTNYWYGGLLALQPNKERGIERLRKELDFLKQNGINNLRVMAAAEGLGKINGNFRVEPSLQKLQNVFDTSVLYGLDVLLYEMSKRNMKAVLFLSNNWEWSGGFLQYLNWNGVINDSVMQSKMEWEDMRDHISKFYSCEACKQGYLKQVGIILNRINAITKQKYINDPTIMSWELANEPRLMRPSANNAYKNWIADVAAYIKSKDKNHLVCLGHEGEIGTQNINLYESIHADKNVDYLTIHIWPKNWDWMKVQTMENDIAKVDSLTASYIKKHIAIAEKLNKPLVIEEFGFPRDEMQFSANTSTALRDHYYNFVFSFLNKKNKNVSGINFWGFNGIARPVNGQIFWKPGDDYMTDPPMEQQSIYGIYDSDSSTWKIIEHHIHLLKTRR